MFLNENIFQVNGLEEYLAQINTKFFNGFEEIAERGF